MGPLLLLGAAAGMVIGGLAILWVGVTAVFVPQDLAFMELTAEELEAVSPRLVPLIAHYHVGYTDLVHIAPAWVGALVVAAGLSLTAPQMLGRKAR